MLKVGLHQLSDTPDRQLALFEEAHQSDKWAEGRSRFLGWFGGVSLFVAVVVGIIGAAVEALALVAAGGVVLVGGIVSLVLRSNTKHYDLDDRKLATVTQFLKIVSADSPRVAPIAVRIDFRPYLKATQPLESSGGRGQPKLKRYQHTWLHLAGALLDGNRYQIEVTDQISRKEKPKRKYTKVKERIGSQIVLSLRLHSRYGGAEAVAAELVKSPPPHGISVRTVRGRGRALAVVLACAPTVSVKPPSDRFIAAPGHELTGDTLLGVLLWCYEGLARRARQPASAA